MILKKYSKKLKIKRVGKLIAYGFMSNDIIIDSSITHIFLDSKKAPGGYFYIAKSRNENGIASIVIDKKRLKKDMEEYFAEFIEGKKILNTSLKSIKYKKIFHGFCNIDTITNRSIGNVLLAGEAGRVLDPLFGYGMRNSIISGYIAANVSYDFLEKQDSKILKKYNQELQSIVPSIEEVHSIRKIFNRIDNDDLDNIFSILSSKVKIDKNDISEEVNLGLSLFAPIFEILQFCVCDICWQLH